MSIYRDIDGELYSPYEILLLRLIRGNIDIVLVNNVVTSDVEIVAVRHGGVWDVDCTMYLEDVQRYIYDVIERN